MKHWSLLQELFEATVDLAPLERERVFQDRAGGDAGLVREVEALIRAETRTDALDGDALELASELGQAEPPGQLRGTRVDAYQLEEMVGAGGMGEVYRAHTQREGTSRTVALKVLRRGLDTELLLARFRSERRTLARLDHSGIVAFLDAGSVPDGRPYLVMEFVEGVPATIWAQEQKLTLRQRLELFLEVLATVDYAHRNLVVHRDIKPSNVLVNEAGVVKLVDFGVARLIASDDADAEQPARLTQAGTRLPLTPAYASPELQRGESAGIPTDVYSLGALLAELLGDMGAQCTKGDLDCIIQAAMQADQGRRYSSVDRFAEDLRRHLAGQPVSARPDSMLYRASLFARRQPWILALAAAAVFIVLAGWGGSEIGRRRALTEVGIGWGAHAEARGAAILFEEALLEAAAADPALAQRLIRRWERELTERLQSHPEVEALARMALSQVYLISGDAGGAEPHLRRVLELSESTRGLGTGIGREARELLLKVEGL